MGAENTLLLGASGPMGGTAGVYAARQKDRHSQAGGKCVFPARSGVARPLAGGPLPLR